MGRAPIGRAGRTWRQFPPTVLPLVNFISSRVSRFPVSDVAPEACCIASASDLSNQRGDDMASQFPSKGKAPIALIVEDDPDVRVLAAALLEETDLRVVECENAEQAMAVLAREGEDVALVFSDIRLPGLDGVDLARRIKAVWPHVSIVVTSGYADRRPDTLPANVVYMPKPWLALDVLMQAD